MKAHNNNTKPQQGSMAMHKINSKNNKSSIKLIVKHKIHEKFNKPQQLNPHEF